MPEYKYSTQKDGENVAKAVLRDAGMSTKQSVNICKVLRGKKVSVAKKYLEQVIAMKQAVPYVTYLHSIPHRKGPMATGRYPIKAAEEFLGIVKSVESNAQFKGMNTNILVITHIKASTGQRPWRNGRKRRRKAKRTNVEIVVEEIKEVAQKKDKKPEATKEVKETKEVKDIKEHKEVKEVKEHKETKKEEHKATHKKQE